MGKKNNPGCNCCNFPCYTDNFTRASIGSDWSVVSGSWSIVSNRLRCTSSNGILQFVGSGLSSLADPIAQVSVPSAGNSGNVRLLINYQDSSNHWGVRNAVTGSSAELFQVVGGIDTVIDSSGVGGTASPLRISYSLDGMLLAHGPTAAKMGECGFSLSATGIALATGTIGSQVEFDDFILGSLRDDACVTPVCGPYFSDTDSVPCQRMITISGYASTGCCDPALDGDYILDFEPESTGLHGCHWRKAFSIGGCSGTWILEPATDGYTVTLEIAGTDPVWEISGQSPFESTETYTLSKTAGDACHPSSIDVGPV